MPKSKYHEIYKIIKERIENGQYKSKTLLPYESSLTLEFSCSRNTLRRAIAELVKIGYVQTMQGKGVLCLFQPAEKTTFTLGNIETFAESAKRTGVKSKNKIISFCDIKADKKISEITGFEIGEPLCYLERLHIINDIPMILNKSYFKQSIVKGLTNEIVQNSVYEYLENELNINIVSSKRIVTVEQMTKSDEIYLDLGGYNCLAVVSSHTFDSNGIMFEYTVSRHHPKYFRFQDNAIRKKPFN